MLGLETVPDCEYLFHNRFSKKWDIFWDMINEKSPSGCPEEAFSGAQENRTPDLLNAIQTLYQLS